MTLTRAKIATTDVRGEKAEESAISSELETRDIPLFLEIPEFPYKTVKDEPRVCSFCAENRPDTFSRFDITPVRDDQTPGDIMI